MMFKRISIFLYVVFCLIVISGEAGAKKDDTDAGSQPAAPAVPKLFSKSPAAPSSIIQLDISTYPADTLAGFSDSAYEQGNYEKAIQFRYWAIQNGDKGYYEQACYCTLAGKISDAMYWLTIDATQGAMDLNRVENDALMAAVRADKRWPELRQYLETARDFWNQSGIVKTAVIKPDNYRENDPVPVLVGLHGKGDSPLSFINDSYQELVNDFNIVIVGISGVVPMGSDAFYWKLDTEVNSEHVSKTLSKILTENKIKMKSAALFGFSQGAQVSLQLAVMAPEKWRGAFAMSPGLYPVESLEEENIAKDLSNQVYFITVGQEEHEYNRNLAKNDVSLIKKHQGNVGHRIYPDHGHQYPEDYWEVFPQWINSTFAEIR